MSEPLVTYVSSVTLATTTGKGWDNANLAAQHLVTNQLTDLRKFVSRAELSRSLGVHATQVARTMKKPGFVQIFRGPRSLGYYYQAEALSGLCRPGEYYPREFPVDLVLVEEIFYPEHAILPHEKKRKKKTTEEPTLSHMDYVHPAFRQLVGEPITLRTVPGAEVTKETINKHLNALAAAKTNQEIYYAAAPLASALTAFAIQAHNNMEVR